MSTRRIVRRAQARRDVVRHFVYLAQHASLNVAHRFLDAVEAACEMLAGSPELGARRELQSKALQQIRMWPVGSFREYLLFYEPTKDGIRLVRVIHAKRDYRRELD